MQPKILLVDDDASIRLAFSGYLERVGFQVMQADCLQSMRELFHQQRFDAVLLDLGLPDGHGMDVIPVIRRLSPEIALIVITGNQEVPVAVEAMRQGADDFLTKPVNLPDLEVFLHKNLELGKLRLRSHMRQRLEPSQEPYFGQSEQIQAIRELALVAAENDSPVLLQGETGTGKGVLAHWIHERSSRASGPFVEVNCSSLRGELLASELFGHAKGAFTSASQERRGLIEVADGGTLFLDEIGDMDATVQAQFLKVIEEKTYRRLGEVRTRQSDFRLICATHRDLKEEAERGDFRRDLFFRVHVFPVHLPPLRERFEDLSGLIRHFLQQMGAQERQVPSIVMRHLRAYHWPGNLREVRNVLERALLLSRHRPLEVAHFPGLVKTTPSASKDPTTTPALELMRLEQKHIQSVLAQCEQDTNKAAKALGISRATLYRKLKKFREALSSEK